ncbi:MAG: NADH-quinone oxidoreductase subunit NuoG, partial [Anaerolineae bacterium]|nr:NADH-quinone oxidoreductase subunit NuoG [Anaerolineae bacterium]
MLTIFVEGQPYEVKTGQSLLRACLSLGFDLPYFCWHPAMGSVGACRQCAVKQFRDEQDNKGRIVMACMTAVEDGVRISIDDPEARAFRASVIEWLMVNHPHDCPICDEGGECHLQDMTVMTGHVYREFRFKKRTHRNQDLGPFINHEMNRCIACYRCVRFYCDHAGGRDFGAFATHDDVYFGRYEDGVLQSEFSGNLVEICPTGVFTDKTLKQHYSRKWDLQTAPSVCVHCGLGCNTIPGERYGQVRRIRNRYNREVNGYFLCDRGRYGYEFVNSGERIREPLLRDAGGALQPAAKEVALERITPMLGDGSRVIGIGSPRASLEANFALWSLVGPGRFYQGLAGHEARLLSEALRLLRTGPARSPSQHEVARADAVLVLGEDVTNTAPMLDLALRQSVRQQPMAKLKAVQVPGWHDAAVRQTIQNERGPLFVATTHGSKLDVLATGTLHGAPDDLARLGFAVAHAVDGGAPAVAGLTDEMRSLAGQIAEALKGAERPLVLSGTSCGSEAVLRAAANVAWALCQAGQPARLGFCVPECNSLGLALMGGGELEAAADAVREGRVDTVIVLENDLYRRAAAPALEDLGEAGHVIVLDHVSSRTTDWAEVLLPAATFAGADGTLVNNEGRAQRYYQVLVPEGEIQESWRWIRDIMVATGRLEANAWQNLDEVLAAMVEGMPQLQGAMDAAPSGDFRLLGQKVPRQSHRYSGRTAIDAHVDVSEPGPPADPDAPLAFSMEGYEGQPPAALIPRFWAPGWNSVQALNKFQQEVGGPLRGGDAGQRLLEPEEDGEVHYLDGVPPAFEPREGEWLSIPVYHIFGSEALSMMAPRIASLAPSPYLALNRDDAKALAVEEGKLVHVEIGG